MRRGRGVVVVTVALLVGAVAPAVGLQNEKKIHGEVRPNEALIYIVRLGELAGKARTERFFLDEHLVGVLPNNSYTFTYATPGTRLFWGSFHDDAVSLDLVGGQTYYLVFKLTESISLVPESAGKATIEQVEHYRTISDKDQEKGTKEGLEKWPRYKQTYVLKNEKKIHGEVRPNEALIYIVRLGEHVGKARTERFFLDEHLVGVLPNSSYTFTYATPGTRLFWGSFHEDAVFLDLVGGQTYYLLFKVTEFIRLVPEATANVAIEQVEHYKTISDTDQEKGTKEGLEKWPRYKQTYASELAVAADKPAYTQPDSTGGLTKVSSSAPIPVELMENASSGANKVGDPLWVRVTQDVVVDGAIFVQKDTTVNARVRNVKGAGGFGRQGQMDIALLSLTASDGSVSPLVGRVDDQGLRKSTDSAYFWGGLLGAFLVKGGQAFSAAGETATAYLLEDVWFKPAETTSTTPLAPDDAKNVGSALAGGPLRCELVKGRGPASVDVILDTTDDVASVVLAQVDGNPLPTPVEAIRVSQSSAGPIATFAGWDICRYVRISRKASESPGGDTTIPANIDPTPFRLRLVTAAGAVSHAHLDVPVLPEWWK